MVVGLQAGLPHEQAATPHELPIAIHPNIEILARRIRLLLATAVNQLS